MDDYDATSPVYTDQKVGVVTELRVKADPANIDADTRKRNVKKLAGAIAHSLRANGEINVRAFGNAAIGKAAKALSIARRFVGVQNLHLSFAPAFITTHIGENELTGISFCTFANEKTEDDEVDLDKVKSVLMVSADPKDIIPEDRKNNVRKLAGAIAHSVEENREVVVRCFGSATIGKASKAIAISRGMTAQRGADLYAWSDFIMAQMGENERTGICFYVFSNLTN